MMGYSVSFGYNRISLAAYGGQAVSIAFRNTSTREGSIYIGDISIRETVNPIYYIAGEGTMFVGDTGYYYALYQEGVLDSMTLQWTSTMAAAGNAVMTGANSDTMIMVYTAEGIDTITFIATNQYGADTNSGVVYVYNCQPVVEFPFHESFETEDAPAGCWTLVYANGNPSTNPMTHATDLGYNLPDSIPDGERVFRFSSMASASDYTQYLISRELNGTDMVLSFQYAKYNTNTTENLRVGYSSTTRDTAAFTWRPWLGDSLSCTEWKTYTDSIPNGTKYVAFQYWGDFAYYVYIDDVTITGSGACSVPVIDSVVSGENELVLYWTSDADSVEISLGTSFTPNGVVLPNVSNAGALGYEFSGLNHSTTYTIGIRAYCSNGLMSDWNIDTFSTVMVDCQTPTNVTVQATTYNTATIGWVTHGDETAWGIRASNTLGTITATATTNPYTITGLTSGMTYTVEVRALCGQNSDIEGDWSDGIQVTTEVCVGVDSVSVSDITASGATATWQPTAEALGYRISYGEYDFIESQATRIDLPANATSYTFTGLEENFHYEFYVQTKCDENLYSAVAAEDRVDFTTLESTEGIYDVETGTLTLYPNPASSNVTLTVSGFDGEVTVEIVDMNGRAVATYQTVNSELGLDVSSLSQGAYFVRVTGERQTAVRKLIVR